MNLENSYRIGYRIYNLSQIIESTQSVKLADPNQSPKSEVSSQSLRQPSREGKPWSFFFFGAVSLARCSITNYWGVTCAGTYQSLVKPKRGGGGGGGGGNQKFKNTGKLEDWTLWSYIISSFIATGLDFCRRVHPLSVLGFAVNSITFLWHP